MKHNLKIILVLLSMFVLTQFIGLFAINYYSGEGHSLPFDMEPPQIQNELEYYAFFPGIIFAFVIAIVLFFLLTKFKIGYVLKLWFFVVVVIALSIFFKIFTNSLGIEKEILTIPLIATFIALPLAFFKIFKRNFLVHNITELFIYPGISTVFVPILNFWTIIVLLIVISVYDMWAVWHSGFMQKMANYQINKLKIFSGFFVPYLSKKVKQQLKKSKSKKKTIKANVAILGGGDIIFPIITAGVLLLTKSISLPFGLKPFVGGIVPAFFVIVGATLGLTYLFIFSEKKKFYPAMPFITTGIFLGIITSYVLSLIL